jgi:hypothetical protein
MPKLLLITVSSPEIRRVRRSRFLNFQQITMPYLAAGVPPGWRTIHIDEAVEDIDWDIQVDVVALTSTHRALITLMKSPSASGRVMSAWPWADLM